MKKFFIIALGALSISMLILFSGCKDDKQQQPPSFVSNVDKPVWSAPQATNMTSSMTAVVKVDLETQYPKVAADFLLDDNDLLGAFAGEQCLGVASLVDGYFFIYINEPEEENSFVTLRYYSAHYRNIFEAEDVFPFRNDDHVGTVAEPFIPAFVVE